ncbi:hypothetical protein ElyMa_004919900 [Elysia marginata]|uniref:Uncharacterized protein n=1 Tax=Elysia marginata TaxID=1093978 RepID=A0AAV4IX29_9GAST|nr:hypothetical protein ElyMa_004919900 [Elysia marginata]
MTTLIPPGMLSVPRLRLLSRCKPRHATPCHASETEKHKARLTRWTRYEARALRKLTPSLVSPRRQVKATMSMGSFVKAGLGPSLLTIRQDVTR